MKKKRTWSSMAKRTACILTALCVTAAAVPGTGGYNYSEVFAAEEADDLREGLSVYLNFEDALTTNSASQSAQKVEVQGSGVTRKESEGISGSAAYFDGTSASSLKLPDAVNAAWDDVTLMAWIKCDDDMFGGSTDKKYLFQQTGAGRSILYLDSNMKLGTYVTASDVLSKSPVAGGKWVHVAFTSSHTAKKAQFYINGKLVNENTLDGSYVDALTDLLIGNHKNATEKTGFKGYMDEVRYYKKVMTPAQIQSIYKVYSENAVTNIDITVDTSKEVREISKAMFGINHRYHNNAYSSWNASEKKVEAKFNEYVKEAHFGSVRYPGGTVSNLFDWKRSIGPAEQRKKTVHGLPETSDPITPNFGLDEAMSWIYDDIKAEAVWVYGMGQGSAADAADLIEYLNAPADGDVTNPNGGVDWAEVRAANGHPKPYGVTRFEIGNEIGYYRQTYWMDGRGNTDWMDAYIDGGRMTFGQNTRTVKEEDWRDRATNSDGTANQVRYVRYTPAVENSVAVYVGGTQWQIVDSLEGKGAQNVCTVDSKTGKITFGDGINGNIPQSGKAITASYQSDRDGFVSYYQAMNKIADELGMEIQVYCGSGNQVSFVQKMAQKGYNNYYDGVVIHPYSDTSGGVIADNDPEFYEKVLGRSLQYNMPRVKALVDAMNQYAPGMGKVPVLSEFGVYNHNTQFVRGIGHAVYIANEMIDYIGFGTPYINKHCLVDYPYGAYNLGSGSQCVIQAIKQNDGTTDFVSTPSAKMFSIFNNMTGTTQIGQKIEGNVTCYTYQGYNVPLVKAISSKDEQGNVYLTVVNNSRDERTDVNLIIDGKDLTGKDLQIWYLTSDDVLDENTQANPNKVDVQKTKISVTEKTAKYSLAPHSVTAFKIPADAQKESETESETQKETTTESEKESEKESESETVNKPSDDKKQTETQTPAAPAKPTVTRPKAVRNVKAKATKKGIRITWKKVSGANGYYIYRSTKKKSGYKKIHVVKKGKTQSYLDKKARKGKTYYYKIRTYKKAGGKKMQSNWSKVVRKKYKNS